MAGTKRNVNGLEASAETTEKKPRKTREVYLNPSYSATGTHESQQLKQAWRCVHVVGGAVGVARTRVLMCMILLQGEDTCSDRYTCRGFWKMVVHLGHTPL